MDYSNDRLIFVTHDPDEGEVWYDYFVAGLDGSEPASTTTTRWSGAPHRVLPGHFHGAVPPPGAGQRSGVPYSGTARVRPAHLVDFYGPSPHAVEFESAPDDFHDTFGRASRPRPRAGQQPHSRADPWEEHTLDPDTTQWTASEATGGSAAAVGRLRDELRDMRDEVRNFSDERENLSDYIRHLHERLDRLDRAYGARHKGRAPDIAATTNPSAKGKGHAHEAAESSGDSESVEELLKKVSTKMSATTPPSSRDWTSVFHVLNEYAQADENAAHQEQSATPGPAPRRDGPSGDGTAPQSPPESNQEKVTNKNADGS